MSRSDWSRFDYDPAPEASALEALITDLLQSLPADDKAWRGMLRRHARATGGFFSKPQIIAGFRAMRGRRPWAISEPAFLDLVKMKPTRTQSGVAPVTVLTKPYPCPGQCIFCPNDVRMPKSYLADEPGAQRAALNRFDPYAQTWNRMLAFYRMGHQVAKIELIVLGGTWTAYPREYQIYFIARCFEAITAFGSTVDPTPYLADSAGRPDFTDALGLIQIAPDEAASLNAYNHAVGAHLRAHHEGQLLAAHQGAEWVRLETAHLANETAESRVVGLVIETRPDEITTEEVLHLRRLGATKIQIGVQSLSDTVLTLNRRGHDVATSRRAFALIRRGGFKIHAHWMANLYGSTVDEDIEDFDRLFDDPALRPDELKLYPCSLIPHTPLMAHYEAGRWRPYTRDELLTLLCAVMPRAPAYCRLSRVIRDIPRTEIHAGNHESNFREVAEAALAEQGIGLREIRAREVRLRSVDDAEYALRAQRYETTVSIEHFLSFETDDALLGFLRLSLPTAPPLTPELSGAAMIREVHVYGQSLHLGQNSGGRAQHRGLGRALVDHAAALAADAGYSRLSVISAVGTRVYYRRLGFFDEGLYLHRALAPGAR
jgi:elongator complex protein 3